MNLDRPHKSRTALTLDLLREAIVHAEYEPGAKLRIDSLGKTLNASIGAVREALSRLTAEGLVVAEPQKGFIVAPISQRDLRDLTEVRIAVETRCIEDSIEHGDLDWEGRILAAQHKLRALGEAYQHPGTPQAAQWHALHLQFHDELASACPNSWWLRLRRQLYVQSERYRRLSGPIDSTHRNIVAEHDAIANAALARDKAAAAQSMRAHLTLTAEIILRSGLPFGDMDTTQATTGGQPGDAIQPAGPRPDRPA